MVVIQCLLHHYQNEGNPAGIAAKIQPSAIGKGRPYGTVVAFRHTLPRQWHPGPSSAFAELCMPKWRCSWWEMR
ncbi:hypothetical protein Ddye_005966 [Dipteronia dyeriana]|uniref:Uncharacterized protein n=1 Tax=Dipteronia dyeriana TaxID=168575 RepID=A0AAD9XHH9_9ROSI|nr:hypothetical protein Ddye_005966 [Dipteronia dyeriana]